MKWIVFLSLPLIVFATIVGLVFLVAWFMRDIDKID